MKKGFFIFMFIMGILLSLTSLNSEEKKFYYAFNEKVSLVKKSNTVLIKYNDGIEQGNAAESIERLSMNFNLT